MELYLNTNLLVDTLLFIFDLFLELLESSGVGSSAVCFQDLYIPAHINWGLLSS